jgi:hypothetical protein
LHTSRSRSSLAGTRRSVSCPQRLQNAIEYRR